MKTNTIVVYDAEIMAQVVAQLSKSGVVYIVTNVNNADTCWEIELTGGC